ncbi:MAG: DUF1905 domain-containing protein [Solirubrobacteraceae bacterium]
MSTASDGPVRFRAAPRRAGRTAGIQVPEATVTALGPSRRPAVRATVNGFTYRSTVAPRRGEVTPPVSAAETRTRRIAKALGTLREGRS